MNLGVWGSGIAGLEGLGIAVVGFRDVSLGAFEGLTRGLVQVELQL